MRYELRYRDAGIAEVQALYFLNRMNEQGFARRILVVEKL
jgi:hypothetical protein